MPTIYITGHRNPDTDSIASAIGYAELKNRLDVGNDYVPVRLGECNAQTRWLLERSGAPAPTFLPHVMPRARDVMHTNFPISSQDAPIREAGRQMAQADLELVPLVDDDGALCGTRFMRQSRRIRPGARWEHGHGACLDRPDRYGQHGIKLLCHVPDLHRLHACDDLDVILGQRAGRSACRHGADRFGLLRQSRLAVRS